MADDIKQTLGFDASDAINALKALDAGFQEFTSRLNSTASNMSSFNAAAGKTVAALVQIKNNADAAYASLSKLGGVKAPGGQGGAGAAGGASSLLSGQSAANAMNQLLGQVSQNANSASNAVNNLGNSAGNAANGLNKGGRASSGFAVSLETLTRVVATQAIVRALSAIRNAVEESIGGFIEFNRAVTEIQTISQVQDLATLRDNVRSLSDEFNSPLLDTAKAKYQALSNGFLTDADSTAVLTAALKLAKVGVSSTEQAVDLLSTGLNSFAQSADNADNLAGKFFKTIQLGRVTAADLSGAFGRVAPIAGEIGVSQDEILAAFSSITIGGAKAAEAATQIRAALNALLKPSDDLKKAFRDLGFDPNNGGKQIIQAKGFQGAFETLRKGSGDSLGALSKLIPNVRAVTGVLRETGSGADAYKEHLAEIRAASKDVLDKTYQIRIESNAEKVAADFNKIKNLFTVNFGESLVNSINSVFKAFGGVDTAISALKALAPAVALATAAIVAFAAKATISRVLTELSAALNPVAPAATNAAGGIKNATNAAQAGITTFSKFNALLVGVTAAFAAFQAGKFIGDLVNQHIDTARKGKADDIDKEANFQSGQRQALGNLDLQRITAASQVQFSAIADIGAQYNKLVDGIASANKTLVENTKTSLEGVVQAFEENANKIKSAAKQAGEDVKASQGRNQNNSATLADTQFNFSNQRFDDRVKSFREAQRALELADDAQKKLASAKTPDELAGAQAEFSRAEAFAKQAASTAQTTKNIASQGNAERTIETVIQKRIDGETQYQKARADDQKKLQETYKTEQERVITAKELAKTVVDNAKFFNSKDQALPQEQIAAGQKKATDALNKLQDLQKKSGGSLDLGKLIGSTLQDAISENLSETQIKQLKLAPEAITKMAQELENGLEEQQIKLKKIVLDPKALEGLNISDQLEAARNSVEEQANNAKQLTSVEQQRAEDVGRVAAEQKKIEESLGRQITLAEKFSNSFFGGATHLKAEGRGADSPLKQAERLKSDVRAEAKTGTTTPEDLNSLIERYNALSKQNGNGAGPLKNLLNDVAHVLPGLQTIVEKLQDIQKLGNQPPKAPSTPAQQADLNALRPGLGLSGQSEAEQARRALEDKANELLNTSSSGNASSAAAAATSDEQASSALQSSAQHAASTAASLGEAATNAQRMAQALRSAPSGGGSVPAEEAYGGAIRGFAAGGLIKSMRYFDRGGFAPRGTDTVPAMLSPGEFVMNAASTRKFYSQLVAMNSGSQPIYRSEGGASSTTNISIGDVNVNGGATPRHTARAIASELRRELRRGTSTLQTGSNRGLAGSSNFF